MICSGFVSAKLGTVYFTSKKKGKVRNKSYFCNIQQKNISIRPIFHTLGQKNILCLDGAGAFIFPQKEKEKGKRAANTFSPTKNHFVKTNGQRRSRKELSEGMARKGWTECKTERRMDKTDLLILRALQQNARLTTKELAAKVHLSTTPVFERVRKMEREGIISAYTTVLNAEKLNRGFVVFCQVKLNRLGRDIAHNFAQTIAAIPEVTECYNISGRYDYLLKIHAPNMKYYQEFVLNVLGTIEHLGSLESTFVMDEIKHEYGICLPDDVK